MYLSVIFHLFCAISATINVLLVGHLRKLACYSLFLLLYKLESLEYRIFKRLGLFVHKIVGFPLPPGLKNLLKDKSCRHMYNMRATDRFIFPKMNTSFGDVTFINFFSRFANLVLSDLISLPEGEFSCLFNKDLNKFFGIFKKNFDWLTLDFGVSYHNTFI